ncbi:hypothetical protein Mro03_38340 [Microbispora rosea subsp. rosea]|nr:hypothetical protein Mro03_38340 [Microbispora rosea subsp. rosea]
MVMPSAPGAPRLASTRLNALPRFAGESICSHNKLFMPGITNSSKGADLPLRSTMAPAGTHRLPTTMGPHTRDGCDHHDRHEHLTLIGNTRRSALPG